MGFLIKCKYLVVTMFDLHAQFTFFSMLDFVLRLPRTVTGHDSIWLIVDKMTKSAYFRPMRTIYTVDKLAKIYILEIVRYMETQFP